MITRIHKSLASKRAELHKDDRGFTLIELLVVVLIIGILAAIAIPVFLGQQDQAKDSGVKSDLANAKVSYVSYLVDNPSGTATGDAVTVLGGTTAGTNKYGFVKSPNTTSVNIKTGGASFCIEGVSASTSTFNITNSGGVTGGNCAP